MTLALLSLVVITASTWACLLPMLREPSLRFEPAAETFPEVPVITFDPRGFT